MRNTVTQGIIANEVSAAGPAIETSGEVFADGSTIELIRREDGRVALMLFDGAKEITGSTVEYRGCVYEPAVIKRTVLQELTLPSGFCPHGTTREFLSQICNLIANFVGLQEKSLELVGRFVLCSALVDAVSVAPTLMIIGSDIARGKRLVELLGCLCRHSIRLTGVTPAGFCSLPSGMRLSYVISQELVSDKLRKLLAQAVCRDQKIPFRGGLLDFFGVQVIHTDHMNASDSAGSRSIQITMVPTGGELPIFDWETRHRVTSEFQAKLLGFRCASLVKARKFHFDVSRFTMELRDTAYAFAASTPDDTELQSKVFDLFKEQDEEIRSERWTALSSVVLEAILVAAYESAGKAVYAADLSELAQEILRRRGEVNAELDPAVFGKTLKALGFITARDARGKKLLLTDTVVGDARKILGSVGISEAEAEVKAREAQNAGV